MTNNLNSVTKRKLGLKVIVDNENGTTYLLPHTRVALKKIIAIQYATDAPHISIQINHKKDRLQVYVPKGTLPTQGIARKQ